MRTLLLSIVVALLGATMTMAQTIKPIWTAKRVYTYTNRTDTSTVQNTYYSPYIEIGYSTAGTDSMKIIVAVDYLLGTTWRTGAARDTMLLGKATNATVKARSFILVAPYAASPLPGATQYRVRATVTGYAAGDSTGVGSYTMWALHRKNN